MTPDQRIDVAKTQAERILDTSIVKIDHRFGSEGYAMKNPNLLSQFIALQVALIEKSVNP